jgi:hypothetical protein
MCLEKMKSKSNHEFQFIPTEISQFQLADDASRQFSKFLIKKRRIKKLIRLSAILPIAGIFICDKYQHRWYVMNKTFVYSANIISFFLSLLFAIYLIIFVL